MLYHSSAHSFLHVLLFLLKHKRLLWDVTITVLVVATQDVEANVKTIAFVIVKLHVGMIVQLYAGKIVVEVVEVTARAIVKVTVSVIAKRHVRVVVKIRVVVVALILVLELQNNRGCRKPHRVGIIYEYHIL